VCGADLYVKTVHPASDNVRVAHWVDKFHTT
jgi:hypothetical protein